MSSYPTRNRKLKNTIVASFQAKISRGRPRKREKKNKQKKIKIVHMSSYPTRNRKFQKNSKKIKKNRRHYYGFF